MAQQLTIYLAAPQTNFTIQVQVTPKTWFPLSRFPFQPEEFSVPLFQPSTKISFPEASF